MEYLPVILHSPMSQQPSLVFISVLEDKIIAYALQMFHLMLA